MEIFLNKSNQLHGLIARPLSIWQIEIADWDERENQTVGLA